MSFWATMAACGAMTFLIRVSFIAAEGRYSPPSWFRAMLPFVPVAALTALIAPDLMLVGGEIRLLHNPRFLAGVVAIGVAWRWKNTTLTIVVGFIALFLLRKL